ncbi:MAG: hypothetical protein ACFBSE_24590 [Prochloraceae cyanobacterium]
MFDRIFEKLQLETEQWVKSNVEYAAHNIGKSVEEFFKIPEPAAPFELIRRFDPSSDRLLSQGCIWVEENAWRIEAYEREKSSFSGNFKSNLFDSARNVVLFEIPDLRTSERIIACRARIKTASLKEGASFQLSQIGNITDLAWLNGTTTRSRSLSLSGGDLDWGIYEVKQHFQATTTPGKIKLEIDFKSSGTIWIKSIELFQAPVAQ